MSALPPTSTSLPYSPPTPQIRSLSAPPRINYTDFDFDLNSLAGEAPTSPPLGPPSPTPPPPVKFSQTPWPNTSPTLAQLSFNVNVEAERTAEEEYLIGGIEAARNYREGLEEHATRLVAKVERLEAENAAVRAESQSKHKDVQNSIRNVGRLRRLLDEKNPDVASLERDVADAQMVMQDVVLPGLAQSQHQTERQCGHTFQLLNQVRRLEKELHGARVETGVAYLLLDRLLDDKIRSDNFHQGRIVQLIGRVQRRERALAQQQVQAPVAPRLRTTPARVQKKIRRQPGRRCKEEKNYKE